jgi:L-malate glycosyltransferase
MNLCFLGDVRSVHVQKFVAYFARDNDTHLISFDYLEDPRTEKGMAFFRKIGTDVHILKKSRLPITPFQIGSIIKKINPDLVQAHFLTNYGYLGAVSGIHPLVVSAMGDDILIHPLKPHYRFLVHRALHEADFITCDGQNSLEEIRKVVPNPDRSAIIYPGIDTKLFNPDKRVQHPHQTVCYPRGFDKIYDVDTLFEVIKNIHAVLPEVKFSLLGEGTELERFKGMVYDAGLIRAVRFVGTVKNENVPGYLASADVCITTSLSDGGIPVSTIEAMACGTPVVSTDAGDARVWAKDVVPLRDHIAMAERIIALLSDEETRKKAGEEVRKKVERSQDYYANMAEIEKIYRRLIAEKVRHA